MRVFLLIALVFLITIKGYSQSLEDLHGKKQKTIEEIKYTSGLLKTAMENERASLNRLRLINSRITQRNDLITNINSEIFIIQEFIDENVAAVSMLKEDIEAINKEYAKLLRIAYLNRNLNDKLVFIFSANDFNQAYRRYLYLKQYAQYRVTQGQIIRTMQKVLAAEVSNLEERRNEKERLIRSVQTEQEQLNSEKVQQNGEIKDLQEQQRDLRRKLAEQQRIEQQLEHQIQQIIDEEAKKAGKPRGSGFVLTPEQKLIGNNFEQNRNRLPWPVTRGIITDQFGIHPHPVLKYVTIRNNGIDISTEPGSFARAVFDGEVSRVFAISGGNMAVIIRHGSYLTVYSNLSVVVVKKGDKIRAKQEIGTIYTDASDGNKTILKFQVWKENQKLNPEEWIAQ
jgi:murein hydrolase activator